MKSGPFTSDHVPQAIQRAIEQRFAWRVYNYYGRMELRLGDGLDDEARRAPLGTRYLMLADRDEALCAIDGVLSFTATRLNDAWRD